MKKRLTVPVTIISLTLATLLGLFYFLSLKPKLALPNKLLETEKILAKSHLNLLQNRLSIMSLVNLDTSSSSFANDKTDTLNKALTTNEKGLEQLKTPEKIQITPGESVDLLNDLNEQLPSLTEENKEIYEQQKGFLSHLKTLNDISKNIYAYNPLSDLGNLDLEKEKDEVIERTSSAIEGLKTIKEKLNEYDAERTKQLQGNISKTQELLAEQVSLIEANDLPRAGQIFDEITVRFEELREMGLALELEIIRSPEMVTLLTNQTNLILKYEYWLNKINQAQKGISKIDLNKIF